MRAHSLNEFCQTETEGTTGMAQQSARRCRTSSVLTRRGALDNVQPLKGANATTPAAAGCGKGRGASVGTCRAGLWLPVVNRLLQLPAEFGSPSAVPSPRQEGLGSPCYSLLWPPKPKLLEMPTVMSCCCFSLGTTLIPSTSSIGVSCGAPGRGSLEGVRACSIIHQLLRRCLIRGGGCAAQATCTLDAEARM